MFLRYVLLVALLINSWLACAVLSRPTTFIVESQKHLELLVKRKQASKTLKDFGGVFDEFADDTKQLLAELDKLGANDTNPDKNKETIKLIASNMAAMEKILTFMTSAEPEQPLQDYCRRSCDDPAWVAICNRPAKNVPQPKRKLEESEEEDSTQTPLKKNRMEDPDSEPGKL